MHIFGFLRHTPMRIQLLLAFIAPAFLILLSASAVYINLEMAMKRSEEVNHDVRAVTVRAELLRSLLDAEAGKRGFVITGNPVFLEPYQKAISDFYRLADDWREHEEHEEHEELEELEEHEQLEQLEKIEALFSQWLNQVARPIIEARQRAPGRLVSRGFDALYHISVLNDVLAGVAEPPEAGIAEDFDELRENMSMAAHSANTTAQAHEWALAAARVNQLPALYTSAMAAPQDSDLREQALALSAELFLQVRDLTHIAVEAEDTAIDLVTSGAGKALVDQIRGEIDLSMAAKEKHLQQLIGKSKAQMQIAELAAIVLPIASTALGLLLLFLMQAETLKSLNKLRTGAGAVARGELDTRIDDKRSDELGDLARSFNRMAEELQAARTEGSMLDSLQAMLVSSQTEAEAYAAATRVCQRLLPGLSGSFHATAASRNLTEAVQRWGDEFQSAAVFHPSECRALRVGRIHCASADSAEMFCDHLDHNALKASACIPLMSRDESLGCLSIYRAGADAAEISSHELTLAETICNRLALALSNLRLAEKLRAQSIRDPLTGLFNRRYLEETLEREIARVGRQDKTLAVIAVDADHFKQFNDEFGHEAGDLVLKALAEQMRAVVRESDIPCRVGGEEFLLVLPEADADIAAQRAEDLRQRIEALDLTYQGRSLGKVTISLGVAVLPAQSTDQEELLRKADAALYRAKREGRNRIAFVSEDA